MKTKITILALAFAAMTVTTQAQNQYLNISNATTGSKLVVPDDVALDVTAAQSKTITFRIMVPTTVNNTQNFGKIMTKSDAAVAGTSGVYGVTFGSLAGGYHTDMRLLATSNDNPVIAEGNADNGKIATTLNDGNWHHFALVLNDTDGKARLYYDGNLLITSSATNVGPYDFSSANALIFGASSSGGSGVNIALDDIRVWGIPLTQAQVVADVTTVITAAEAPTTANLLANFDFNTIALNATSMPDITGKTANATLTVGANPLTKIMAGTSDVTLATNSWNKTTDKIVAEKNQGVFEVSSNGANLKEIIGYDVQGRQIFTQNNINSNSSLLNGLPQTNGVIILKVTTDANETSVIKLIN